MRGEDKLKVVRFGLTGVVLAGMICALVLQRQALNRVQQENKILRQQLADQTSASNSWCGIVHRAHVMGFVFSPNERVEEP